MKTTPRRAILRLALLALAAAVASCGDDAATDTTSDTGAADVGHVGDAGADAAIADTEDTAAESEGDALAQQEDGEASKDGDAGGNGPVPAIDWPRCDEPGGTTETLAEKAAHFDDLAWRVHVHPELKFITGVTLPAGVSETEATWADVEVFHRQANDGLWNALYMASQAYRYAVTGDPEVLDHLKILLEGEVTRMEVTGVTGLFTRSYVPPGIPAISCPAGDASYTVDVEKDDDRWVRIGDGGCVEAIDHATGEWFTSDHCGLEEFAGYCFLDNVSQDEYSGHFYGLGAIAKLVDDADVQATITELMDRIGAHYLAHEGTFVDWDGRLTEHGLVYAPVMLMAFGATPAALTSNPDVTDWYHECLLQSAGPDDCLSWMLPGLLPLQDAIDIIPVFNGNDDCLTNWNNVSMHLTAFQNIFWFEDDPAIVDHARQLMDQALYRPEFNPRRLVIEKNPWYTWMWAHELGLHPDDGPEIAQAARDAHCMMQRFPASRSKVGVDATQLYEEHCLSRLDNPLTAPDDIILPEHRCPGSFMWWFPPYRISNCAAKPQELAPPMDYLLAYWLGRFHGFIGPDD